MLAAHSSEQHSPSLWGTNQEAEKGKMPVPSCLPSFLSPLSSVLLSEGVHSNLSGDIHRCASSIPQVSWGDDSIRVPGPASDPQNLQKI